MTPLLTVEGLGVEFPVGNWPRRRTLRASFDVSFSVGRGEIVALARVALGPEELRRPVRKDDQLVCAVEHRGLSLQSPE